MKKMTVGTLSTQNNKLEAPTKKVYNWANDAEFYEHCKAIEETLKGSKNART